MPSRIKIDQAGLSAGVAGVSRTDGKQDGALVTLEDVGGSGQSTFHLLWGPPADTTAEASLAATGDPDVWTFTPTAGLADTFLIELRDNGVPIERRIFGIRTTANHLLLPALNERASRHANWTNDGPEQVELSENNAVDFPDPVLNQYPYAGWWRSLRELYQVVEAGVGGIADHALSLVKLQQIGAKSVLANANNATGDVTAVAGTVAFQYLRVNSTNNGLQWGTLTSHASTSLIYDGATNTFQRAALAGAITAAQNSNTTAFGNAAAKSVLANATNASAVPAFLAGSAAFQYLRVNSANNALEMATLSSHASTSLIYDGATNTYQRAALTGAVTSAQNSNATAFGNAGARSILANLTNGSAVPAFSSAPAALQMLRANSDNTALEWAGLGTAVQTTAATLTNSATVLAMTPTINIPANTLAVGDRFRLSFCYRFVRGATATALNLNSFFDVSGTPPSTAIAAQTAAGTYELRVEAEITILTLGAGGTAMGVLTTYGTAGTVAGSISSNSQLAMAIDTTNALAMRGAAQMNTAVANCSITALGGHIERIK